MASSTERDAQLLEVGKQCSHPQCQLVDFLPFKCQHCQESFCQEHYRVKDGHQCASYDESKHNRVAPDCPLCHTPVAVKPGQDPNVRMEQHFESECSVVTGRVQAKKTPICARNNCKKVLFSPIRCDQCREQFCPSHRFPSDHTCKAPSPARQTSTTPARPNLPSLASASSTAKGLNTKASAKASEAVASVKQSVAAAKASTSTAAKSMPFNKTDRRSTLSDPLPLVTNDMKLRPDGSTSTPTNFNVNQTDNEPTKRPPPVINPLASFTPPPLFGFA